MRNHDPILIEEINGFWSRGEIDTCPPDHFTEFINHKTIESGSQTRDGVRIVKASTSPLRIWPYPDAGVGDGYLELRADNKIYHVYGGISFGVPSFTVFQVSNAITGMTDFAFTSINGRAYISPSTSTNLGGLPGEFIYVYDGGGVNQMRKAAGTGPTVAEGAMAAANSATTGNVEAGIHVFGVVYETNSGFLTQIGPDRAYPTVTATGTKKVDLSAIPIFGGGGGTLITKRHIVASKLIDPTTYNGDPSSYQLFFVPGGTIANNTATTLTVNFFDSELIDDASHLLDLLSSLKSVSGLGTYHNRMLAWDIADSFGDANDGINICMVSYPGEPEAMDSINGFIEVPRVGTGITYCQEYRDILYVAQFNRIAAFNDNGDVPTSWPSAAIDQGLGCGKYGVVQVGIYGGINVENFIVLNDQGIYTFTGNLTTPELSYKIKDYWQSIAIADIILGKVQGYNDSVHQQLIIVLPNQATVLVGDYSNGLTAEKIKWQKWTFSNTPGSIMLFDKDNKLFITFATGVHWLEPTTTNDTYQGSAAVKIPDPTLIGALLPNQNDDVFNHYCGARLRVSGSGVLLCKLYGLDNTKTNILPSQTLSTAPGLEYFLLGTLVSQKSRLEIKTTGINETFKLQRYTVFAKPIYTSYPAVS
jgi:hypothetical protein